MLFVKTPSKLSETDIIKISELFGVYVYQQTAFPRVPIVLLFS